MPSGEIKTGFAAVDPTTKKHLYDATTVTMVGLFSPGTGHVGTSTLNFYSDFGVVELRVAIRHSAGYAVQNVVVDSSKGVVNVPLQTGDSHASVTRVDRGVPAEALVPVGYEVIVTGNGK